MLRSAVQCTLPPPSRPVPSRPVPPSSVPSRTGAGSAVEHLDGLGRVLAHRDVLVPLRSGPAGGVEPGDVVGILRAT